MQGRKTTWRAFGKSLLEYLIYFNMKAELKWHFRETLKGLPLPSPDVIKLEGSLRYWFSKHAGVQLNLLSKLEVVFSSFAHSCKIQNHPVLREFQTHSSSFRENIKKAWVRDSNLQKSVLSQNKQKMDTNHRFIFTSLAHLQTKILHVKDTMSFQALCLPTLSNSENKASQFENFTLCNF